MLIAKDEKTKRLIQESQNYPKILLNARQLCDLELLLNGGFSPLSGYLNKKTIYLF